MVKGISRQVIVVHGPEEKLFEQAIFILRENAHEVTDEQLLQEANRALRSASGSKKRPPLYLYGPVWALSGAAVTGLLWFLTVFL